MLLGTSAVVGVGAFYFTTPGGMVDKMARIIEIAQDQDLLVEEDSTKTWQEFVKGSASLMANTALLVQSVCRFGHNRFLSTSSASTEPKSDSFSSLIKDCYETVTDEQKFSSAFTSHWQTGGQKNSRMQEIIREIKPVRAKQNHTEQLLCDFVKTCSYEWAIDYLHTKLFKEACFGKENFDEVSFPGLLPEEMDLERKKFKEQKEWLSSLFKELRIEKLDEGRDVKKALKSSSDNYFRIFGPSLTTYQWTVAKLWFVLMDFVLVPVCQSFSLFILNQLRSKVFPPDQSKQGEFFAGVFQEFALYLKDHNAFRPEGFDTSLDSEAASVFGKVFQELFAYLIKEFLSEKMLYKKQDDVFCLGFFSEKMKDVMEWILFNQFDVLKHFREAILSLCLEADRSRLKDDKSSLILLSVDNLTKAVSSLERLNGWYDQIPNFDEVKKASEDCLTNFFTYLKLEDLAEVILAEENRSTLTTSVVKKLLSAVDKIGIEE